jgi:hypothetical protein
MDAIDIATGFIGTNNRAIFNDWFYMKPGVVSAYCGTFVSYCRDKGGSPLGRIDYTKGFAGVPFAVKHYKTLNKITDKPVRNDIVFFDWSGKKENFEHTGLFKCDNGDGTFTSIEGNTSNPYELNYGGQSNGGWVMEKRRSYNDAIFAHP